MNKIINIFLIALLGMPLYWKCPMDTDCMKEVDYMDAQIKHFILDCSFYPMYKDRRECVELAKIMKCKPWKHYKDKDKK